MNYFSVTNSTTSSVSTESNNAPFCGIIDTTHPSTTHTPPPPPLPSLVTLQCPSSSLNNTSPPYQNTLPDITKVPTNRVASRTKVKAKKVALNKDKKPAPAAKQGKRVQVKVACVVVVNCRKACKKCDEQRPCQRCKTMKLESSCVDSLRNVKSTPFCSTTSSTSSCNFDSKYGNSLVTKFPAPPPSPPLTEFPSSRSQQDELGGINKMSILSLVCTNILEHEQDSAVWEYQQSLMRQQTTSNGLFFTLPLTPQNFPYPNVTSPTSPVS